MPFMDIITLAILSVSAIFSLYKQLQMLQQNSYFPSRYFKWFRGNYALQFILSFIYFYALISLAFRAKSVLALILTAPLLLIRIILAVKAHRKSIKKLVFTARIKRLFATAIILLALLNVAAAISIGLSREIFFFSAALLGALTPMLTIIVWALTWPIEKAVGAWYISDAKKILKNHKNLTVIGITGSYGKTTTKFILNRILSEKFNTVCTPQSFNTPMGVVRTVRTMIKPQTQVFVCEMGAKNVGDIKEVCDIANPKYGIITSVGEQHLETFKSVDNVFKTKFELADAVAKNGGVTLANIDSEGILARKDTRNDVVYFGNGTDYFAENITYGAAGSTFDLVLCGSRITVNTRLLGLHSVADILSAAAMAHILGVSDNDIKFAISALKPTEHRLELKSFTASSLLIDDAYNSNPEGCLEAVRVLGSFEGMRKVIITPGLIELGEREYDCNYALGLEAAKYCDTIILVGKNRSKPMMDAILTTDFNRDNVYVVSSFKEALEIYAPTADKNSVVLIENDLPDNYLN